MKVLLNLVVAGPLLVLAMGMSVSVAHQKELSHWALPFSSLAFEIASPKNEFLPLEPIPLTLELSNRTKSAVSGHRGLDFSQHHIELFVAGPNGLVNKVEIKKPILKLVELTPRVYEPGESYRSKQQLITINPGDVLSQPGEYRIQAVVHGMNWYEEVKSNLLPVRIVEAKGVDKLALDYLKGTASISELFAGFDFSEDEKALVMLEGLTHNFGDTVYAEYASFRLGSFYFARKNDAKAKEYFDKLAEKTDFIFADRVSDYRNKLKARQLDLEKD